MWDFGQDARPAIWRVEWLSETLERLDCFTPWFAAAELAESVPAPSKPDGGAYLVLTKLERDYLVISKIIARAGQFPVVKTGDIPVPGESPAPKKRGRPKATPPHKHHFVSSGGRPRTLRDAGTRWPGMPGATPRASPDPAHRARDGSRDAAVHGRPAVSPVTITKKAAGVQCGDCDRVSTGKMICTRCAAALADDDEFGCHHEDAPAAVRSWAQRKWTLGLITNERRDFLNEVADDMEADCG